MDLSTKTPISSIGRTPIEDIKEEKYVTLDTGAKISGYTKEYLEHLCRLNKVNYRLWNNGQFVVELESLLRETQTILLSYEGIIFVDKKELSDPISQVVGSILSSTLSAARARSTPVTPGSKDVLSEQIASGIAQPVPMFQESHHLPSRPGVSSPFSYVGHSVVSDPLQHAENDDNKVRVPISAPADKEASRESSVAIVQAGQVPVQDKGAHDEWDKLLLGGSVPRRIESEYHPIETSIDPSEHHDPAPLFPPVGISKTETLAIKTPAVVIPQAERSKIVVPKKPQAVNAATEEDRKVIVFSGNAAPEVKEISSISTVAPQSGGVSVSPELFSHVENTFAPQAAPQALSRPPRTSMVIPQKNTILSSPRSLPQVPPSTLSRALMREEEHHLSVMEPHPLMKNAAFNVVVLALLVGGAVLFSGGFLSNDSGVIPGGAVPQIAGAGAALPDEKVTAPVSNGSFLEGGGSTLPFSDEVVVTPGKNDSWILVQPVFRNGAGEVHEYELMTEMSNETP